MGFLLFARGIESVRWVSLQDSWLAPSPTPSLRGKFLVLKRSLGLWRFFKLLLLSLGQSHPPHPPSTPPLPSPISRVLPLPQGTGSYGIRYPRFGTHPTPPHPRDFQMSGVDCRLRSSKRGSWRWTPPCARCGKEGSSWHARWGRGGGGTPGGGQGRRGRGRGGVPRNSSFCVKNSQSSC